MSEYQEFAHHGTKVSSRTTISVGLREAVDVETISRIIVGIGSRYGCRTCGLLGIDVRLTGDPVEFPEVANLPGVRSISAE